MPDPTQAAYDPIAADYAALQTDAPPARVVPFAERLLARLPPGARLLDLGCGPGRDLAWLAAQGAAGVGCDLSAGMLAPARARGGRPLVQADMRVCRSPGARSGGIWCCGRVPAPAQSRRGGGGGGRDAPRAPARGGTLSGGAGRYRRGLGRVWLEGGAVLCPDTAAEVAALLTGAGLVGRRRDAGCTAARPWLQFPGDRAEGIKTGGGGDICPHPRRAGSELAQRQPPAQGHAPKDEQGQPGQGQEQAARVGVAGGGHSGGGAQHGDRADHAHAHVQHAEKT